MNLRVALIPAGAASLLLLCVGVVLAATLGFRVVILVLPFAALSFAVLAWTPLRTRHLSVTLHSSGLVVENRGRRDVAPFDQVKEVWLKLDVSHPMLGVTQVRVLALRLVLDNGAVVLVPTTLVGTDEVARAVVRRCSYPLVAPAVAAVRDGESLTFGPVVLDQDRIRGTRWSLRWADIIVVRFTATRVSFVTSNLGFARRSVRIDEVPHPTVFIKLVSAYAKKTEVDGPLIGYG